MRIKYNLTALKERFNLSDEEIEKFITEANVLLPDGWDEITHMDRIDAINKGFSSKIWSIEEVERFDKLIYLIKDKHLYFYRLTNTRMNEMSSDIQNKIDIILARINNLRKEMLQLISKIDRNEAMIDSKYFCAITGYAPQTFRNKMQWLDDNGIRGRLKDRFYHSLMWYKRKGNKWWTSLAEFEELRSGFSYELWLAEKKRKGEYRPKIKGKIDDIK